MLIEIKERTPNIVSRVSAASRRRRASVFKVGDEVRLSDGEIGTVLADPGDGPVRVQTSNRVPHPRLRERATKHGNSYGYLTGFAGGEQHASRADLILANWQKVKGGN